MPKFELKFRYPGSLPCIEGSVTKEQHSKIYQVIGQYHIGHPDYNLSKDSGAFFQGGFDWRDNGGDLQWVLIEFWRGNIGDEHLQKFVDRINEVIL